MALGAFFAATAYLFVFAREDAPRTADVVVVLAGSPGDRLPEGLKLVRRGVAPVLYVSDGVRETSRRLCRRPKAQFTLPNRCEAGRAQGTTIT